jgi:hypothetical protein
VFQSFFLAGFECSTGYNVSGEWIDQIRDTQHERFALEDYRRLREVGIAAVREGVRWPLVDRGGGYDFSSLEPFLAAARRTGMQVIYDLFHFGYPRDADPFSSEFPGRFGDYCAAVARHVAAAQAGRCFFTPLNEPSYFSWAGGEVGLFAPHLHGRGADLKRALVRAMIQGIDAIRSACPGAVIVNADPVCRVVAPVARPDLDAEASRFNDAAVFEALDMLSGRSHPELGGSAAHLGIVGVNYYWTNQWELGRAGVPLGLEDARRVPLGELVRTAWRRYGRPMMITETAHVGEMRPAWIREIARECQRLLDEDVPLLGVCLYPILGMPEWHARDVWAEMGVWDLVRTNGHLMRVAHEPTLEALREAQRLQAGRIRSRLPATR